MKSRLLLNLALLLGLASLALVIWLKPGAEEHKDDLLVTTAKDTIHTITIKRVDQDDIRLEKQEAIWRITQPIDAIASSGTVALLLTLTAEPIKSQYSSEGKNLEEFGLSPEKLSIVFNDNEQLVFGVSNPISHDRYILKNQQIILSGETIYGALTASAASFLDTKLLSANEKIKNIALPDGYTIAEDTIANWQEARALEVFDWDETETHESKGVITLNLESGQKKQYDIIQTSPELFLGNKALKAKYHIAEENIITLLPK